MVPQCCKHCSLGVTAPQSRCGSALVMVRHDEGQFISPGHGKALSAARNVPFRHPVGPSPSFRMDFPENGNATPALRCESRIAAIMVAIANIFLWIYEISNLDPCRSAQNRDVWDAKGGLMRLGWSLARSACGRWPTRSRDSLRAEANPAGLSPRGRSISMQICAFGSGAKARRMGQALQRREAAPNPRRDTQRHS